MLCQITLLDSRCLRYIRILTFELFLDLIRLRKLEYNVRSLCSLSHVFVMHQFWNDDDSAKNTRSAYLWKIMG